MLRLRSEDVTWRAIEGELVALDLRNSTYFAVNASGTHLWERLAEGATREQLVSELQDRFDVPADRAAGDVDAFVASLQRQSLLDA